MYMGYKTAFDLMVEIVKTEKGNQIFKKEMDKFGELIDKAGIPAEIKKQIEYKSKQLEKQLEKQIEEAQINNELQQETQEIKEMHEQISQLNMAVDTGDDKKAKNILKKLRQYDKSKNHSVKFADLKDAVEALIDRKNWGMLMTCIRNVPSDALYGMVLESAAKEHRKDLIQEIFKKWKNYEVFSKHCIDLINKGQAAVIVTYLEFKDCAKSSLSDNLEFMNCIIERGEVAILDKLWDTNTFKDTQELLPTGDTVLIYSLKNKMEWLSAHLLSLADSLKGTQISEYFYDVDKDNNDNIRRLLELEVSPEGLFQNGETLLTQCIKTNNEEMLDCAIEHNADVGQANPSGELPLQLAVDSGSVQIVKKILSKIECAASPQLLDSVKNSGVDMVKLFMQEGIKIPLSEKDIQKAFEEKNWEIVIELVKDMNTRDHGSC